MALDRNRTAGDASGSGTTKNKDLSNEDLALKRQLELYVEGIQDSDPELQKAALESLREEIRAATSSMTSVPKPVKFLCPHYETLQEYFATMDESDAKKCLADIISVLAFIMTPEGEVVSLSYKMLGNSDDDIGSWGHAYVSLSPIVCRFLLNLNFVGDLVPLQQQTSLLDDLMKVVEQVVAFHMQHNAEHEAVDLLIEVESIDMLLDHVDKTNFKRTCLYLTSLTKYLPTSDAAYTVLDIAYMIYSDFEEYQNALQIALLMDEVENVSLLFISHKDLQQKKQFCYLLARHGVEFVLDPDMVEDDDDRELLQDIINNSRLSEGYLTLARDIEVMEPKSPEDIYKAHLLDGAGASVDSARKNLAATFVNAFVNAGFGQDKLMTVPSDSTSGGSSGNWLFKNEEHGKISAAASLGMIFLWDIDNGFAQLDKYCHSNDDHVIAGALLGFGIVNTNIRHECNPAMGILCEFINDKDPSIRIGAIMGLGIAYAGSQNDLLRGKLSPILSDALAPIDVIAFTAISLGLVYVGSCDEAIAEAIILAKMNLTELDLGEEPLTRLLPLGLGLLYLGKQESMHVAEEMSKTIGQKCRKYSDMSLLGFSYRKYSETTLLSCAYAGTGNVRKVQFNFCGELFAVIFLGLQLLTFFFHAMQVKALLGHCSKHFNRDEMHQGPAVLGIAMVAMAEELGLKMAIRSLKHLLQYGEQNIRRVVPLALGLLCISNPNEVDVMDTLSRLSRDSESEVAMAAVMSLGLIGAGTNNARIAAMLRNLSSYYDKDSNLLFCVRIAQGLVYMGKGLLTLNPYHSDGTLLPPPALAGLITVLFACLDMEATILGQYHYVLYFLALAMQPRMLMTVDENLKPLSVPVRVGQAVDGRQAGRPKTTTRSQTHSTPVLLSAGEKAELATEKYIPLSPILEGFVILKDNPDYREDAD
ncbi:hypothetical protein L6164_022381 [Bauhinia variegata]|uniref:Uncharacterized protein n=1 Tax=Bauhinia variegata TaxID=167791 RepID=A0ACB9MGU0_BAUVA|nr:hypothetical protein L6164_022381 [Bauhinia variegata]